MKTSLLATLIGTILAAGAAVPVTIVSMDGQSLFDDNQAGADESNLHNGHAGDEHHAQLGMERPRFAPATGTVPTPSMAESMEEASFFDIRGDSEFNPANGVRSGSGTPED